MRSVRKRDGGGAWARGVLRAGAASLSLAALAPLSACGGSDAAQAERPAPQVGVLEIAPQAHEMFLSVAGRVTAFEVAEVRPQIGGIVLSRNFEEGTPVRAGALLYQLDPAPARAALASAEAAAQSAQARFERYKELIDINAISQQDFDDAKATADQAAAAAENARINLAYTRVSAPISGIIGVSSVTAGALATPLQQQPFATIRQIDQIYVDINQSSSEWLRLNRALAETGGEVTGARVRITLDDGSLYEHEGRLEVAEASVDESTGTVRLRALVPNPDHVLLPGMFVQARISTGVDPDAILAPQAAVSRNPRGQAVALLLNSENVVEQRVLETAGVDGDAWIVSAGLSAGDRLIVDGLQTIRPGQPAQPAPAASARTATPAQSDG